MECCFKAFSIEASLEVLNHQVCSYVHWHVRHEINHSPKDVECIEDINEQKIMMQVREGRLNKPERHFSYLSQRPRYPPNQQPSYRNRQ